MKRTSPRLSRLSTHGKTSESTSEGALRSQLAGVSPITPPNAYKACEAYASGRLSDESLVLTLTPLTYTSGFNLEEISKTAEEFRRDIDQARNDQLIDAEVHHRIIEAFW